MDRLGEQGRLLEVTKVLRRPGHHRPKALLEDSGRIHVQLFRSPARVLSSWSVGGGVIESTVACKAWPKLWERPAPCCDAQYSRRTKRTLRTALELAQRRVVVDRSVAHAMCLAWAVCCNGVPSAEQLCRWES